MKNLRFVLLVLIASGFTLPANEVKLEYTFTVGAEFEWKQTAQQSIKQTIAGMEQNIENTVKSVMRMKVTSLTANGAKLETQFANMSMVMKVPMMGDMAYESEGDQEKTENKIMKAMMNKPFTVTLTKRGEVEKIEGADNLWSDFSNIGMDEQQAATMKQQMQQNFGEASIKSSIESALMQYPDKKIKAGDSWKSSSNLPGSLPLMLNNTWSVSSIAGEVVKLTSDGVIETTDKEKAMTLPNGIKSKVDLKGAQKLFSTVNPKTGWPSEVKSMSEDRKSVV